MERLLTTIRPLNSMKEPPSATPEATPHGQDRNKDVSDIPKENSKQKKLAIADIIRPRAPTRLTALLPGAVLSPPEEPRPTGVIQLPDFVLPSR